MSGLASRGASPVTEKPEVPLRGLLIVQLGGWLLSVSVLETEADQRVEPGKDKKLRVVVFGPHPDDPESGCGGLIALLTRDGHEVIVAYATCYRGQRRIGGEPESLVRRREATEACRILGARPHFFDYAHEKFTADEAALKTVSGWLKEVKPDVVVTHWPLDTHPNHHVASSLVWQCYTQKAAWSLYFFEVMTDQQTLSFRPDLYLDVESVYTVKQKALRRHQSQQPDGIWKVHDLMSRRRGVRRHLRRGVPPRPAPPGPSSAAAALPRAEAVAKEHALTRLRRYLALRRREGPQRGIPPFVRPKPCAAPALTGSGGLTIQEMGAPIV
jgi:LmbE family N-acetylglucosaminyl deacetylase